MLIKLFQFFVLRLQMLKEEEEVQGEVLVEDHEEDRHQDEVDKMLGLQTTLLQPSTLMFPCMEPVMLCQSMVGSKTLL